MNILPFRLPGTQSFFYMPLITYSYYKACNYDIPTNLSNSLQILSNLSHITQEILIAMCNSVTAYLCDNSNNLEMLKRYYSLDSGIINLDKPTVGHIGANYQEKILEEAIFVINEDIYKENIVSYYYDNRIISVKEALDFYLLATYYPNHLLVEK